MNFLSHYNFLNIEIKKFDLKQISKFDDKSFKPLWSWKYIFWKNLFVEMELHIFIFRYYQALYIWILKKIPRKLMLFL